jgi:hypothetical protein
MGQAQSTNRYSSSKLRAIHDPLKISATQVVTTTTNISGVTAGQQGQTYTVLPGQNTGYNANSSVITKINWIINKSTNGIGGINQVWWCDYWNAGSNPFQYTVSGQWGTNGGGASNVVTTAPTGYAVSGLAWTCSGGFSNGLVTLQIKFSYIGAPGISSRKPDVIMSVWNGLNGFSQGLSQLTGSITTADLSPQASTSTPPNAPTQNMGTQFLNSFGMNWWPDGKGNWLCGGKGFITISYIDISIYLNSIYSPSAQFQAGCCFPGAYSAQDEYTAACSTLGLTSSTTNGCSTAITNYCESNIGDANCQSFLINNNASGAWDALVNTACSTTAAQNATGSAGFCACYKPITFDSSVPASLQVVLQSQPQCANVLCSTSGYKNSTARNSCAINVLQCLNTTNITAGVMQSTQISVNPSSSCQQTVNNVSGGSSPSAPSGSPSTPSTPSGSPSTPSTPSSPPSTPSPTSSTPSTTSSSSTMSTQEIAIIVVIVVIVLVVLIAIIVAASSSGGKTSPLRQQLMMRAVQPPPPGPPQLPYTGPPTQPVWSPVLPPPPQPQVYYPQPQ